jgi:hypothetical protein
MSLNELNTYPVCALTPEYSTAINKSLAINYDTVRTLVELKLKSMKRLVKFRLNRLCKNHYNQPIKDIIASKQS